MCCRVSGGGRSGGQQWGWRWRGSGGEQAAERGGEELAGEGCCLAGGRGIDAQLDDLCPQESILLLKHCDLALHERERVGRLLSQFGSGCQLFVLGQEVLQVLHCLVQYCALAVHILCEGGVK